MGCRNHPPCLRNQLFPKSVHLALGVLGVTDLVPAFRSTILGRHTPLIQPPPPPPRGGGVGGGVPGVILHAQMHLTNGVVCGPFPHPLVTKFC